MTIDPNAFKEGYIATLRKDAGLLDDLGAGWQGAKLNNQNTSVLSNPLKWLGNSYEGFKAGYAGKVMNDQTQHLQNQGVSFQKDQFGRLTKLNMGDTIKNYAGNALQGLTGGNGLKGFAQNAGNFLNEYKWPLLGGLGGAYLLKKLLFSGNSQPKAQAPQPFNYGSYGMIPMVPQALQKAGSFLPEIPRGYAGAMSIPTMAAQFATSVRGPGVGQQSVDNPQHEIPGIHSENPDLQRILHDPKMRDYLNNLITQIESDNQINKPASM